MTKIVSLKEICSKPIMQDGPEDMHSFMAIEYTMLEALESIARAVTSPGTSSVQVEKDLKLKAGTISKWLSEKKAISLRDFFRLFAYFGLEVTFEMEEWEDDASKSAPSTSQADQG